MLPSAAVSSPTCLLTEILSFSSEDFTNDSNPVSNFSLLWILIMSKLMLSKRNKMQATYVHFSSSHVKKGKSNN